MNFSPWAISKFTSEDGIGFIEGGVVGVKILIISFVLYFYYKFYCNQKFEKITMIELDLFILSVICLFCMANLFLQMSNRWMILTIVLFSIRLELIWNANKIRKSYDSFIASILFSIIALPQVTVIFINNGWIE